jgi:hypothetical protein
MQKRIVAALPLALTLVACGYDNGDRGINDPNDPSPPPSGKVEHAAIDTGATLADIEPGQGAGAFIEYDSGGDWHIYTTCDTAITDAVCSWDILVTPLEDTEIENVEGDRDESDDFIGYYYGDPWMQTFTSSDFDGFFVTTNPGGSLRIDVVLDGQPAPRFVYWVSGGALNRGAPTNPLDFTPTEP